MPRKRFAGILGVCIALTAQAFADEPDSPWWDIAERGSRSLPELVQAGWEIVGFDVHNGEDTVSRDYILQHPGKPGAWHCNALYINRDDGTDGRILSCTPLKQPN